MVRHHRRKINILIRNIENFHHCLLFKREEKRVTYIILSLSLVQERLILVYHITFEPISETCLLTSDVPKGKSRLAKLRWREYSYGMTKKHTSVILIEGRDNL